MPACLPVCMYDEYMYVYMRVYEYRTVCIMYNNMPASGLLLA